MSLPFFSPAHPAHAGTCANPVTPAHPAHAGTCANPVSPAHLGDHLLPDAGHRTRRFDGARGATFSEVLVAAVLTSIGVVGVMGAFDAADKIVMADDLATRALALAESRLEVKRAVPWAQLLFDDLDHDGVLETSMHDDGSEGDRIAGDGIYSALQEQEGVTILWTVAAHSPGPLDTAGAVVIEARGMYAAAGRLREVRLATLRANSSLTGRQ